MGFGNLQNAIFKFESPLESYCYFSQEVEESKYLEWWYPCYLSTFIFHKLVLVPILTYKLIFKLKSHVQ